MAKFIKKDNEYLAEKLYEYADWLDALGNNPYKVRAYQRAARVIQNQQEDIGQLIKHGFDLTQLPKIGKGISYFIHILVETGDFPQTKSINRKKLNELLDIKGLGPKRIQLLNNKYNIYTRKALSKAIRAHQLDELGIRLIEKIKEEIKQSKKSRTFLRLYHGLKVVKTLIAKLESLTGVQSVICCGDYRRKREIIEQLALIIQCTKSSKVLEYLITMPFIDGILQQDQDYLKVRLTVGINMDVYCVNQDNLGSSLIFLYWK